MPSDRSSEPPLRVALVGCGKMGLHHARAIRAQSSARLVAAVDPKADRAKVGPILGPDVQWYDSVTELLEAAAPDIVHIVTPPASHAALATQCLSAGAHVYVEKPFALTYEEARDVLGTAQLAGRIVCPGHQLLFERPARKLKENLGLIGRPIHIESYFAFRPVRKSSDGRTLMSPVEQLIDILPHPVYTLMDTLRASSGDVSPKVVSVEVRPEGEVHAILRAGPVTGVLVVTLRGRPVESYLRVVGTNGSLRADFVRGALTKLPGPGTSFVARIVNAYREATQIFTGSTRGFVSRVLAAKKGYPGVTELVESFYQSVRAGGSWPLGVGSILDTVGVCERVAGDLRRADEDKETEAQSALAIRERQLLPASDGRGTVLVTGATGMLGREVVADLRGRGWRVRGTGRRVPPPSKRVAGVDYAAVDLSQPLPSTLFCDVTTVVHCAAETAGGKDAHQRNTIDATRNLLREAASAGVKHFVHVSSIAVLKPGKEVGGTVNEQTPVDAGNLARGPYVWAKAESERDVAAEGPALGMTVHIVRPGPLVDFDAFEPPGRLGRELGPVFVAIGPRRGKLSLCRVQTAAQVIRAAVADPDNTPQLINLVEPEAPTRVELMDRWLSQRPDLRAFWLPGWVLSGLSPSATLAQRILRPKATPVNLAAAFSSEVYDARVAAEAIRRAESAQPAALTAPTMSPV